MSKYELGEELYYLNNNKIKPFIVGGYTTIKYTLNDKLYERITYVEDKDVSYFTKNLRSIYRLYKRFEDLPVVYEKDLFRTKVELIKALEE